jgi:hypothetical protein
MRLIRARNPVRRAKMSRKSRSALSWSLSLTKVARSTSDPDFTERRKMKNARRSLPGREIPWRTNKKFKTRQSGP